MLPTTTICECGNATAYCGCLSNARTYCTHPNQEWCDCDWCRVWRGYRQASKYGKREEN